MNECSDEKLELKIICKNCGDSKNITEDFPELDKIVKRMIVMIINMRS